jgi:lactoylglutathione lyase
MKYLHHDHSNLEQSVDFFINKLGFVEQRRQKKRAATRWSSSRTWRMPVELTYNWDPEVYTGGTTWPYGWGRQHLRPELMDGGVTINRPPRDGNMAFIKTPDGISIELLQKGPALPKAEPWASMANTGSW